MSAQNITRQPRAIPVYPVNPGSGADVGVPVTLAAQIPAGATGLSVASVLTGDLRRIVMPANWTAANLTFQTSEDGVTWSNLYDRTGVEYTVTAAASHAIQLPVADFAGVRNLIIRSGTSAAPVNQLNAPTLQLVQVP